MDFSHELHTLYTLLIIIVLGHRAALKLECYFVLTSQNNKVMVWWNLLFTNRASRFFFKIIEEFVLLPNSTIGMMEDLLLNR